MGVSPWESQVRLVSPDGKHVAEIPEAREFVQGGPTSGELILDGLPILKECGVSLAWSDDARFIAVPMWKIGWIGNGKGQKLIVLDIGTNTTIECGDKFRLIEVQRFEDGVVAGVDSPAHKPRPFTWRVPLQ